MLRGSKRALERRGDGASEHNGLRAYLFAKARATKMSLALILSIFNEPGLLIDDGIGWDVRSELRSNRASGPKLTQHMTKWCSTPT